MRYSFSYNLSRRLILFRLPSTTIIYLHTPTDIYVMATDPLQTFVSFQEPKNNNLGSQKNTAITLVQLVFGIIIFVTCLILNVCWHHSALNSQFCSDFNFQIILAAEEEHAYCCGNEREGSGDKLETFSKFRSCSSVCAIFSRKL